MGVGTVALVLAWAVAAWHLKTVITFRISTAAMLFGALLVVHGVPLLLYLYLSGPGTVIYEAALEHLDHDTIIQRLQLAVAVMFFCATLGSLSAGAIFPAWRRAYKALGRTPDGAVELKVYRSSPTRSLILLSIILLLGAVAVVESQASKVLNFYSASLSEEERSAVRLVTGGSPIYLYNVFVYSIGTFLAMTAYVTWRYKGTGLLNGFIAVSMFGLLLVAKLDTLSKAPPATFILQFVLLYLILAGRTFSLKTIVYGFLAALILFGVIVKLTFPSLDVLAVFHFLYYRAFEIPNEVLLEYFAAIPATLPYEWGAGLFEFLRQGSGASSVPTYFAVAEITRGSFESSSNAMFIADAWAQFSWLGIWVFSFLAGLVVRGIDLYAFGRGKTDETACIIASCSFGVLTILSTSLPTALITGGLALIPLLSFLMSGRGVKSFKRVTKVGVGVGGQI